MKLRRAALIALTALAIPMALAFSGCEVEEEKASVEKKGGEEGGGEGATAAVGDNLSLKGTTYKVTGAETASSVGDQYTGAEANGIFVIVDLTLTNEEDEPATILEDNLNIIGGNGDEYSTSDDAVLAFPDQSFLLEEIQPGLSEDGKLVFDIPPAAVKGAKLQVEDLFSSSTGEIDLGL
ncbi:hypothetical protein BH20ACT15_BH20ACT15_02370 [soil metagenome]